MGEQEKLANAMNRLADKIEQVMDPIRWQRIFHDALQSGIFTPTQVERVQAALPVGATPVSMQVELSNEERERLVTRLHEAVKPQIAEFSEFVKESLEEMPAARLKAAAEQLERGKEPKLARRPHCIFLDFGDNVEFYLPL